MTGSSAAALIGLMFVVITITAGDESVGKSQDGISTYSTPTVLHFGSAFLVSALFAAPLHSRVVPAAALAIGALWGLTYVARVAYRSTRLPTYSPDLEDIAWYGVVPFLAYGVLLLGAIAYPMFSSKALCAIGAGVVLLIFLGVRNAWDVVTFLAIRPRDRQ
jgi:hypothetical protein